MDQFPLPPQIVLDRLREGIVIPAHPLALTSERAFDERRQRALTRYYHAAGAGGIAVGVHSTQFEIRRPEHGLFKPVLELAAETISACDAATGRQTVRIAGITGRTQQALEEARFAVERDYHAGLVSLSAFKGAGDQAMIDHCRAVACEIPLIGFYLQPSAGGRLLTKAFWRRFVEIPNVIAIKIAPFNRYQTLDVLHAVAESGRADSIALYTGNDDNIVADLLTEYVISDGQKMISLRIVGGLLGHWAYWTQKAVAILDQCRALRGQASIPANLLTLGEQITDCNAAVFDAAHQFAGLIPGVNEVLRRQGLMESTLSLKVEETFSPNQLDEIDRVYRAYPHLTDDDFVRDNLDQWLS
ncbi:MAG: dihydrodipicolinate synthase family protein [Chloroflexota bacterium]